MSGETIAFLAGLPVGALLLIFGMAIFAAIWWRRHRGRLW